MRDPDVLRRLRGRLRDLSLAGIRSAVTPEAWRELAGPHGLVVGPSVLPRWQVRRVLCVASRYSHGMTSAVSPLLPPDQYIDSLARKRMAAGALFRDEDGRVLLVDPTYKPTWDLPGGAVEKEESPHAAWRREVTEELGLDRPPGRVLVVDWVPSRPERPEGLIMVYDGGVLAPGEVAAITTQDSELAGYAFVK